MPLGLPAEARDEHAFAYLSLSEPLGPRRPSEGDSAVARRVVGGLLAMVGGALAADRGGRAGAPPPRVRCCRWSPPRSPAPWRQAASASASPSCSLLACRRGRGSARTEGARRPRC